MKILNHCDNAVYLDFGNGIEMSTVWGYLTYSDAHDGKNSLGFRDGYSESEKPEDRKYLDAFRKKYQSTTVEMMFTKAPEDFLKRVYSKFTEFSPDSEHKAGPYAYMPVEDWLTIVNMARKYVGKKPK